MMSSILVNIGEILGIRYFSPIGAHEKPTSGGNQAVFLFPFKQEIFCQEEVSIIGNLSRAVDDTSGGDEIFQRNSIDCIIG